MNSISFSALTRVLAAAVLLTILATGAHAQENGGGRARAPAPPAAPGGQAQIWQDGADLNRCGGGLTLAAPSPDVDLGDAVDALSHATQDYIKECQCVSQQCVADALDRYAAALAAVAPRLPRELQDMPDLVARAAHRVRVAKTKAEAIRALNQAAALIHKDITLVRAEDPDTQQRQTRSGALVIDTLNVASLALEKGGAL